MKQIFLYFIFTFFILGIPLSAFAGEKATDAQEKVESQLEDELGYFREESQAEIMVMTDSRHEHKLSESSSAISVITKEENHYFVDRSGGWLKGADVTAVTGDGRVIGGDMLKPERLTAYEAGIRIEPNKRLSLDVEYFQNYVKDTIGYQLFYENTQTGGRLRHGRYGCLQRIERPLFCETLGVEPA